MDLLSEILRIHDAGETCVLATIVHTQGSIPSYQSSRMVVRQDGSIAGTVGGGCVEADVWAAARELRTAGESRRLTFELNADPRYDTGLTCGGTLEVHLSRITPGSDVDALREIVRLRRDKVNSVLVTVLAAPQFTSASAPSLTGARFAVAPEGTTTGSEISDTLRNELTSAALSVMDSSKPHILTLQGTEMFFEPFAPSPRCILMGAGHVAQHVAPLMASVGFDVLVADDRQQFANSERFPTAHETIAEDWELIFQRIDPDPSDHIVIVTRGHKEDMTVLRWAVQTSAGYIGLIGSRRKVLSIYTALVEEGIPRERFDRVHAPIGLEIGALTPEEIAVSVAAELISVRRGATQALSMTVGSKMQDTGSKLQT